MKRSSSAARGQRDVPALGTVDVRGLEGLHEAHRLGDALPESGKACLVVGIARDFGAGEPGRGALGEVRRKLDLAGEGEHVGASRQLSRTDSSMLRSLAKASAFSNMASRFLSMAINAGTEA